MLAKKDSFAEGTWATDWLPSVLFLVVSHGGQLVVGPVGHENECAVVVGAVTKVQRANFVRRNCLLRWDYFRCFLEHCWSRGQNGGRRGVHEYQFIVGKLIC